MEELPLKEIIEREKLLKIRRHLDNDGIIIYPTDTLYGMGCNFFSETAKAKIDKLKKRKASNYSVIVSDFAMMKSLSSEGTEKYHSLIKKLLPGKITIIVKASETYNGLPVKQETIGIRIPETREIRELVKILNFPLVTTSVNHSSFEPLNKIDKIRNFLKSTVSDEKDILIVNGGNLPYSKGSTIVDLSKDIPSILREGDEFKNANILISQLKF